VVLGSEDFAILNRLRSRFLDPGPDFPDYWTSERVLALYDSTYGRRIWWKWDWVIADLRALGWEPPAGVWVDWACGTGVASRAMLDGFPASGPSRVHLVDRSPIALRFSADRLREHGQTSVVSGPPAENPDLLLVSHVIDELGAGDLDELVRLAGRATAMVWVEPGDRRSSTALVRVREALCAVTRIVAPCTHQERCGMPESGWCHHFATPPAEAFTTPEWGRFAEATGIDLRSLPLSFLVTDQRTRPAAPADTVRLIARPRTTKGDTLITACDARGVSELRVPRRQFPDAYKLARKGRLASRLRLRRDGSLVTAIEPDHDMSTVTGA
jgi:hypothetical protein